MTQHSSISQILPHLPQEVIDFYGAYSGVLTAWQAPLALERADFILQMYQLWLENNLNFKSLVKHYGMRPVMRGGKRVWLTSSVAPAWRADLETLADAGIEPCSEDVGYGEIAVPQGLIADSNQFAALTRRGLRNAQVRLKHQAKKLADYQAGLPDCQGQYGLFVLGVGEA